MLTIKTVQSSNASGATVVIAKGLGRQRTIKSDPALSTEVNHAAAVGTLLDVLCDDRQKAMLRHPSGGMRVMRESNDAGVRYSWSINV